MTVTVTYPERVTGSRETGEVHSAYKFVLIRKRSTRLPVNTYQNTIPMGVRRRIAKILDKPYEYEIFCLSSQGLVYIIFTCSVSVWLPKEGRGDRAADQRGLPFLPEGVTH